MLPALHPIDFGILLLYFGGMLAIGCYFRHQSSSREFLLAGRAVQWLPLGLASVATLVSGWTILAMPGQAYEAGLRLLVLPVIILFVVPLVFWYLLPMYRGLGLSSIYEYLELRFSASTRLLGSSIMILCELLWLGVLLCAPYKLFALAVNLGMPPWAFIAVTGLVTTVSVGLGGLKAVIWSDVLRTFLALAAVLAIISAAWFGLQDGPSRVWEVATTFDRHTFADATSTARSIARSWETAPHYFFVVLALFVVDQITVQRYLAAKTLRDAQRALLLNCLFVLIVLGSLIYAGLCLLAFYHDHPQSLRAKWVANVDGKTRQSLTFADRNQSQGKTGEAGDDLRPLLDWNKVRDDVTADNIERLIQKQRLLHPNRQTPWQDASELLDSGNPQGVDIEKLAMRRPPRAGLIRGEVVLNKRAVEELVPWFIANQLPFGVKGLVLVGIIASTMCTLSSGINSIATLLLVDFHRRFGYGRKWLARRLNKSERELTNANDFVVARVSCWTAGLTVTFVALALAGMTDCLQLLRVLSYVGAVLSGVFLLGLCTRRATAVAATWALLAGIALTSWLIVAHRVDTSLTQGRFDHSTESVWWIPTLTCFTFAVGYALSFFCGQAKSRSELRGLVLGCGEPGERQFRVGDR